MNAAARTILRECLRARLSAEQSAWLDAQCSLLASAASDNTLAIAFGMASRRLPKAALEPDRSSREALAQAAPGWALDGASVVDAVRMLLLAASPAASFADRFRSLCRTADLGEAIALYRGLPIYPDPQGVEPQVGEGLRTNVLAVFEAIAHGNPYPQQVFDEHRWNHMVLKALFVGSRLAPIFGLDARANPELARIMIDFAHERRAAGRPVPVEIWRCVGPFATGALLGEFLPALDSGEPGERDAAVLGLIASPDPAASALLARIPERRDAVMRGELRWERLATFNPP